MKRPILLILIVLIALLIGCGRSKEESIGASNPEEQAEMAEIKSSDYTDMQNERSIELLKEQYPEYFELSSFKGIEVFVWETADDVYRCGIMSGTNRMKTGAEIQALEQKSLSITEAKMILEEYGVEQDSIIVIPITQPYPDSDGTNISKPYTIDEEQTERINKLFADF